MQKMIADIWKQAKLNRAHIIEQIQRQTCVEMNTIKRQV